MRIQIEGVRRALNFRLEYQTSTMLGCHSMEIRMLAPMAYPRIADTGELYTQDGVRARVLEKILADSKLVDALFEEVVSPLRNNSLVVMSGLCNTPDGKPDNKGHAYLGNFSIAHFASWLKEKGEFIMATPLMTNVNHIGSNFSLLRAWMWLPDHSDVRVKHIEGTEYVSGAMKNGLPLDKWKKFYNEYYTKYPLFGNGRLKDFNVSDLYGN